MLTMIINMISANQGLRWFSPLKSLEAFGFEALPAEQYDHAKCTGGHEHVDHRIKHGGLKTGRATG